MDRSHEILVVDDDDDIRETVRALLEAEGYRVRTAENGADALAKLEERPSDVVLLDVRMPVMDGTELRRRLLGSASLRDVPIVFMSAYADLDEIARDLQVEQRLCKPFDLEDLHAAVERATRGRA